MNRQQQIDAFLLVAHELAGERLQCEPACVAQAISTLESWRARAGANRSDVLWDEWQDLLAQPVERIIAVMTERSDHGDHLRSVSPMGSLITQAERAELLRNSRHMA